MLLLFCNTTLQPGVADVDARGMSESPQAPRLSPRPIPSADLPAAMDTATAMGETLNRLLDQSIRSVVHALREVDTRRANADVALLDESTRALAKATSDLANVSELVHAAMQGANIPLGSSLSAARQQTTIAAVVAHAIDVVAPEAKLNDIQIHCDLSPQVQSLPSGPLYAVVLAGLRNAIAAICDVGRAGHVDIQAHLRTAKDGFDVIEFHIRDDGVGPPRGIDPFTWEAGTPSSRGLLICKTLIDAARGTIRLERVDPSNHSRPGALLRFSIPKPAEYSNTTIPPRSPEERGNGRNAA